MFVMMNAARLGVGNQSLGLTEVAFQNALAYAKDRIQMRSLSGTKAKDKDADPIIVHPDVRKMLLTAKAYAEGARALQVFCTLLLDKAHSHPDEKVRADSDELVALLTPIVKAFVTDNGHIATNACMQVFGGHGFIKEWGMEQFVRDNRINMIYEGTNTIQSLDLLGRKVLGNQGATLKKLGKLIGALVQEEGVNEKMAEFINPIAILGEQNDQVHHRNRLQRHAKPRRSGRGRRRLPARGWPPGVWLSVCPHGASVAACHCQRQHRPVLHRQAANGALLLCQAVPRDRALDAHRPRWQQGADGYGCGPGLIHNK